MNGQGPLAASTARRCLALAVALMVLSGSRAGRTQDVVQGFAVIPVTVEMFPGERATILTIRNHTDREATFQVRPFTWSQPAGNDQLGPTDALLVSPPLGVLPAGSTQVVRLVLRRPAEGREITYRILLDQVPAQPTPGQIGFVLRLSIPVFVDPPGRIAPQLSWALESQGVSAWLVARNIGSRRQVVHDMKLVAADGRVLSLESNLSPYILAGGVRRWRILGPGAGPSAGGTLRLTALADTGEIDQAVPVLRAGP